MSDDEADAKGAAEADAYAAEFAGDSDYDESVFAKPTLAPPAASTGKRPREEEPTPWSLIVKLRFDSEQKVSKLKEIFETLATYIKASEPTTLAYELLLSDKDPLVATIFERYADKEKAYAEVHKSSSQFLTFRAALSALEPKIDGDSYYESSGAGFINR